MRTKELKIHKQEERNHMNYSLPSSFFPNIASRARKRQELQTKIIPGSIKKNKKNREKGIKIEKTKKRKMLPQSHSCINVETEHERERRIKNEERES